jgi:hypothetical protein
MRVLGVRAPRGAALTAVALTATATPATAQSVWSQRASVEFVGAITQSTADPGFDPFIVIDGTATIRMTSTMDVVVRPYFRRLPGGDWSKEMYQLQVRYQPDTSLPFRIDAGIISSPLGIIALEMRPDRNPIIGAPSYYFSPLPSFDGRFDRVQLLSGVHAALICRPQLSAFRAATRRSDLAQSSLVFDNVRGGSTRC